MNIADDEHVVSIASFPSELDDDDELTAVPVDDTAEEDNDIPEEEPIDEADDTAESEEEDSPEEDE
jgi:hypothetical protein